MVAVKLDKKRLMINCLFYAMALLVAFGLKSHYSGAGFEDLAWILTPTAGLTETISGDAYEREENCGFINRDQGIIIAPSCAGVNFLIIAFCMAVFSFVHLFRETGAKLGWFCASAAAAYGLTIVVNSIRISISTILHGADIYSGWITYERIHRFEGVAVYFLFLYVFYMMIRRIVVSDDKNGRFSSTTVPLLCYLTMAIGVPAANFAFRKNPALFAEHCIAVFSISVGLYLLILALRTGFRRTAHQSEGNT